MTAGSPAPRRGVPTEQVLGLAAIIGACGLWGLSGLYFDRIAHVPPLEVLAHRVVWSLVFFVLLFLAQRRLRTFVAILTNRRLASRLLLSSLMVSVNWFGYIFAIQSGLATEASLGYYLFPLVAVALGYVVFGERFGPRRQVAIALATAAVIVLGAGLGAPPWIALALAGTFGIYGMIKKTLEVGPVMSVGVEVALLAPVAAAYIAWLEWGGQGAFGTDATARALLPVSVMFTGVPLILFSYASRRLAYATLGVVQYLNPTLQFTVAMLYFGEPFTTVHAIAFALIWTGVALYAGDLVAVERRAARSSIR